jgi:SOUL heme-binding protein
LKGIDSAPEPAARSALSVVGIRAHERPPRRVVGRAGPAEVREYGPRPAAETALDPGTRNQAFGLLAGCIFGNKRAAKGGGAKIAMTALVEMRSERIATTAPVQADKAGTRMAMRFFLLRSLARAAVRKPVEPRVRVIGYRAKPRPCSVLPAPQTARVAERKEALLRELRGSA